jgi:TetR/AcrR family transcriptional regulator, cholesterol catabolism regulator
MGEWVKRINEKELNKMCAIGRAASKLFNKKGYLETSLKDISTSIKLSKGGIYHYFSSKHEILYFILGNYIDLLHEGLEDELKAIDDPSKKIRYIMLRHLRLFNKKAPQARAMLFDARNLPSEYFEAIALKQKKYAAILTSVLSEHFATAMSPDELKTISYIFFGICNSIMYWYDPKGAITLDELSEICYGIFMKGISGFPGTCEVPFSLDSFIGER